VEKVPAQDEFRAVTTAYCVKDRAVIVARFSGDTLQGAIDSFVTYSKSRGCTPLSADWVRSDRVYVEGVEFCPPW
jgi:hypothetical protein